jgi:enamine deaminase RidA (YjgF/YER057c/UK114 family)
MTISDDGREQTEQCFRVLRKHFGEIRPAATMIVAALVDPRIRIEIEVTARRIKK